MGLETGTYINDLVNTNPPNSDQEAQGAAHLRLVKSVLQNTFPGASRAWPLPSVVSKTANFSVLQSNFNTLFLIDTTAGVVTMTLPTLASGDAGWTCSLIKTNSGLNPVLVAPPAGTITSGEVTGLSATRRCIPGHESKVYWTGTAFFITRVPRVPLASIVALGATFANPPVGYEWPNGQVLASVATNYPDYNSVVGSGSTVDLRGRAVYGQDNMGGSAANRITVAGGNFDGTIQGNSGGAQNHALVPGNVPAHTHGFSGVTGNENQAHNHNYTTANFFNASSGGSGGVVFNTSNNGTTQNENQAHNHNFSGTTDNGTGSGSSFTTMDPAMTLGEALVVE